MKKPFPTAVEVQHLRDVMVKFRENVYLTVNEAKVEASIYFHILVDDVPRFIDFWKEALGTGIALFWSSVGEHLNKLCKTEEALRTNFSGNRLKMVLTMHIARLLYFTESIKTEAKRKMTCGNCGGSGHSSRKTTCPNFVQPYGFDIEKYFSNVEHDFFSTNETESDKVKSLFTGVHYVDYFNDEFHVESDVTKVR